MAPAVVGLSGVALLLLIGASEVGTPIATLVCIALALAAGAAAVRGLTVGVIVSVDELVVRRLHRTYRLDWADIAGASVVELPTLLGWHGLRIDLRHGKSIRVDEVGQLSESGGKVTDLVRVIERAVGPCGVKRRRLPSTATEGGADG